MKKWRTWENIQILPSGGPEPLTWIVAAVGSCVAVIESTVGSFIEL